MHAQAREATNRASVCIVLPYGLVSTVFEIVGEVKISVPLCTLEVWVEVSNNMLHVEYIFSIKLSCSSKFYGVGRTVTKVR